MIIGYCFGHFLGSGWDPYYSLTTYTLLLGVVFPSGGRHLPLDPQITEQTQPPHAPWRPPFLGKATKRSGGPQPRALKTGYGGVAASWVPPQSRRSFSLKAFLVIFLGDPYDPYGSLYNWVTMSSAKYSTLHFPGYLFIAEKKCQEWIIAGNFPAKIQSIFKGTENTQDAIAGHHQNLWYFSGAKKTFRMPPMASG